MPSLLSSCLPVYGSEAWLERARPCCGYFVRVPFTKIAVAVTLPSALDDPSTRTCVPDVRLLAGTVIKREIRVV